MPAAQNSATKPRISEPKNTEPKTGEPKTGAQDKGDTAGAETLFDAARKLFSGLPSFQSFAKAYDADTVRQQMLSGIKQVNAAALTATTKLTDAVAKVIPMPSVPFAARIHEAAKANLDFFGQVLNVQHEFAMEMLDKLIPAS